ncbi:MAG TPA: ABC transporter ATP-binding protein [Phnomibacter sp.]|nr:ABC transporter ATP-binding protein [Phnomibacter sp.]
MSAIIKVQCLSKQYRLGQVGTGTIKDDLNRWWHRIRGKEDPYLAIGEANDRSTRGNSEYIWALKDINFEVQPGEVLGIIGRNGAGKSTLLKILSRVTEPTTGSIEMHGRVASLLEVGTGFHPDLTGRENIYLNGAILGMTKKEITSKFDEIVDFAGVERYIDTPVKRYSSGMHVRLGFAVAAHLEPEILIVDEVLAVGDAEFQKKCLGKMKDVSKEGRTVLFVSHNMSSIQKLCTTGTLMNNGRMEPKMEIKRCIDLYLAQAVSENKYQFQEMPHLPAFIKEAKFDCGINNQIRIGESIHIKVTVCVQKEIDDFICAVGIVDSYDISINTTWSPPRKIKPGVYIFEYHENNLLYTPGNYRVVIGLSRGTKAFQFIEDALSFVIESITEEVANGILMPQRASGIVLNQMEVIVYES